MSGYGRLGAVHSITALSMKVTDMQRELAALRQDVRTLLFLLESRPTEAVQPGPRSSEDAKLDSESRG